MNVSDDHPDRHDPLLSALGTVLEAWGAQVVIDLDGENSVRLTSRGQALVCAQGLPNLIHEFVHALNMGGLDDDHGIDYGRIPFPLATVSDRLVLWDELACCVVSCAYLEDPVRARQWFAEQLEIQPVFYGFEDDPARFWRVLSGLIASCTHEWTPILESSQARLREAVGRVTGTVAVAEPRNALGLPGLWGGFERQQGVGHTRAAF